MSVEQHPSFNNGVMFTQTPCQIAGIGHDLDNLMTGYDLQGTIAFICPRPFCLEIVSTMAVDDLPPDKFDELQALLKAAASSEGLNDT